MCRTYFVIITVLIATMSPFPDSVNILKAVWQHLHPVCNNLGTFPGLMIEKVQTFYVFCLGELIVHDF